ncbi:hypothetical protein V8D89_016266, partial [Ganoderma adspersum]
PHVRAALMMGGIVWWLTMEFISESDALWQHYASLVVDGPTDNTYYQSALTEEGDVDNHLSQDKLNTICGLYKVYTATENQTKDSTWWPKQSQWMNSGMYTGFWTPWNEAWYQTRLTKVALRAVYPISS